MSEGVEQAQDAGIGERNSESNGASDGEGYYENNQQTPQVRPAFPSIPAALTNGRNSSAWMRGAPILYPR